MTNILTEQIAPLAPHIVTPGFASNRRYLQQPITFQVRFQSQSVVTTYHLIHSGKIEANQITAIYLSPQAPNYFQMLNQPVALYRYKLLLTSTN